jgi:hypothetical protein
MVSDGIPDAIRPASTEANLTDLTIRRVLGRPGRHIIMEEL